MGASLAASLTTFTEDTEHQRGWPEKLEFRLVCRLLGHLWLAQREGKTLSNFDLLELEPRASERQILDTLHELEIARYVTQDQEDLLGPTPEIGEHRLHVVGFVERDHDDGNAKEERKNEADGGIFLDQIGAIE